MQRSATASRPNVPKLMKQFEVSERTVRADLEFLRERLNAPLVYDRARGGYRYTDPTWTLPTLLMSEGELLAFFLSVELAHRYLGTAFETPLRKAVERLAGSLPDELQVDLSQLAQHYTFQAGATAGADPTLLALLFECVRERWPVEVLYLTASSGERKRRVIEPYHLFNVRGDWQVMAFDHLRQNMRQFAVSRIEEWVVLKANASCATLTSRLRSTCAPASSPSAGMRRLRLLSGSMPTRLATCAAGSSMLRSRSKNTPMVR
jgi:Predicted transcriptional regulator